MRGLALALPGFIAFAPEWQRCGAACAAHAIPAPESALRLRPRRAVSSAFACESSGTTVKTIHHRDI